MNIIIFGASVFAIETLALLNYEEGLESPYLENCASALVEGSPWFHVKLATSSLGFPIKPRTILNYYFT